MTNKEFDLSERRQDEYGDYCYKQEDVKEFIRLLKEEIDKKITTDTHGVAHSRCEGLWLAKDIIKNSAGDKLCQ